MHRNVLLLYPLSEHSLERFLDASQAHDLRPILVTSPQRLFDLDHHRDRIDLVIETARLEEDAASLVAMLRRDCGDRMARIAGVVPCGEFSVDLGDTVAERLHLIGNASGIVARRRDKAGVKAAVASHGVNQARLLERVDLSRPPFDFTVADGDFPVICKPADASGSYFVSLCHDRRDIAANLDRIAGYRASLGTGVAFKREALIEQYLPGDEGSLECVIDGGTIAEAYRIRKFTSRPPYFDEIGHLFEPAAPVPPRLLAFAQSVVAGLGLRSGVAHVEFKEPPGGEPALIEVNSRVAGDMISDLIELGCGVALEERFVALRCGREPLAPGAPGAGPALGIRFVYQDDGDKAPPAGVRVVRGERAAALAPSALSEAGSEFFGPYHIRKRTGFTIVAGGRDALERFITDGRSAIVEGRAT